MANGPMLTLVRSASIAVQRWLAFVAPWFVVRALAAAIVRPLKTDRILLLGSAPMPSLPQDPNSWKLWAVNASARQADMLGLGPPSVTVVDRGFFTEPNRSVARAQVTPLDLGRVIAVSTIRLVQPPAIPDGSIRISRFQRSVIVRAATGSRLLDSGTFAQLSTGGFSACLATLAASEQVFLAGFTMRLEPGTTRTPHFYEDPNITPSVAAGTPDQVTARKHSAADSAALSLISLLKVNLVSLEPDLIPLLTNWGQNPPAWHLRRWT